MPTIAVDFDGVVHAYSRGWGTGAIYDQPMPGALKGIERLREHYSVYIHTTRNPRQVAAWLDGHGVPVHTGFGGTFWEDRSRVLVTNRKLPAVAYVDDRAHRFTSWEAVLSAYLDAGSDDRAGTDSYNLDTTVTRAINTALRDTGADLTGCTPSMIATIVAQKLRETGQHPANLNERLRASRDAYIGLWLEARHPHDQSTHEQSVDEAAEDYETRLEWHRLASSGATSEEATE